VGKYQLKKSGLNDRLPLNRYRPKPLNKTIVFLSIVVVLLTGYFIFRYDFFLGKPALSLTGQLTNSSDLVIAEPIIKIEGNATGYRKFVESKITDDDILTLEEF